MTRRGRNLRFAASFLLLGLLTSVGVAWWSCLWERPLSHESLTEMDLTSLGAADMVRRPVTTDINRAIGHDRVLVFHPQIMMGFWPPTPDLLSIRLPRSLRWSRFDFDLDGHEVIRAGWPLRCLESERRNTKNEQFAPGSGERYWSIRILTQTVAGPASLDGTVPVRPLPLGMVANSLLFACVWALPCVAFAAARRRRRMRRGLCPACAYDLRALPSGAPCPECGYAVAVRP